MNADAKLQNARSRLQDAERHLAYQSHIIARLQEEGRPIADAETLLLRLRVTVQREQAALVGLLERALARVAK